MKGLFDRLHTRGRSIVGAHFTRGLSGMPQLGNSESRAASHPAADAWARQVIDETMEAAKALAIDKQLRAIAKIAPVLPPAADQRLRDALENARRAMPFVEFSPGGDLDRVYRIPQPAASIVHFKIGEDHLPSFAAPTETHPSEHVTISDAVLQNARVMRAGARLLTEPKVDPINTGTGVPVLRAVPVGMSIIKPAVFSVVDDPDDELPLSALVTVLADDRIDRYEDLKRVGFRVSLTRREEKDRKDGELMQAVLDAVVMGLANAADAELLGAISAAAPQPFSFGAAAAKGLRFEELRAIVGSGDTQADGDRGELFWRGIPAELSNAASPTFIGAFDRFGVAIGREITLLIKRTSAEGSVEITCWAGLKAIIPDLGYV